MDANISKCLESVLQRGPKDGLSPPVQDPGRMQTWEKEASPRQRLEMGDVGCVWQMVTLESGDRGQDG